MPSSHPGQLDDGSNSEVPKELAPTLSECFAARLHTLPVRGKIPIAKVLPSRRRRTSHSGCRREQSSQIWFGPKSLGRAALKNAAIEAPRHALPIRPSPSGGAAFASRTNGVAGSPRWTCCCFCARCTRWNAPNAINFSRPMQAPDSEKIVDVLQRATLPPSELLHR